MLAQVQETEPLTADPPPGGKRGAAALHQRGQIGARLLTVDGPAADGLKRCRLEGVDSAGHESSLRPRSAGAADISREMQWTLPRRPSASPRASLTRDPRGDK